MESTHKTLCTYVGVDVSKHTLDVVYDTTKMKTLQVENKEKGFKKIVKTLSTINNPFCILESTGGYEIELANYLLENGILVSIVNPKKVRDFAKAMGKLAKTDKIDAYVLAKFGETFDTALYEAKTEDYKTLRSLVKRRNDLIKYKNMEKSRLEHEKEKDTLKSLNTFIKKLDVEIKEFEEKINKILRKDPTLDHKRKVLTTFKGVGEITAFTLITELPELGTLDRKKIAALSGLAPYNNDSGKMRGQRHIKGGRSNIRSVLYMAYMSATSHNDQIRMFRNRLISNGVTKCKIKVACMRKMLTILNAMLRDDVGWNEIRS